MLFERTCQEHGITARLTKRRSPTTTGKIERFHQTLRRELLDQVAPFADLETAQAAIDGWVHGLLNPAPVALGPSGMEFDVAPLAAAAAADLNDILDEAIAAATTFDPGYLFDENDPGN